MEKEISKKEFLENVSDYLESNSAGAVVTKVLLATIALGGVVCVGAVAPNLMKMVGQFRAFSEEEEEIKKSSIQSTFSKFKRDGYVLVEKTKEGNTRIGLTEKGKRYVYNFTRELRIKKPIIWDRKWRVVIFDIPVKKKRERGIFRQKIIKMGFQQLQKSVWVVPYKCEDEVLFLAQQLRIVRHIEILTVQKMVHNEELKKRFFS